VHLAAEDRLEILDTYGRYCLDFDGGNAAGGAGHFAADGEFVYVGSRAFEGRDAIRAMFERRQAAAPGIRHFVGNIVLEPALEGVLGHAYVIVLRMGPGAPLRVVTIGQYDDLWVRLAEGWRIKRRTFTAWLDPSLIDAPLLPDRLSGSADPVAPVRAQEP
jgi:hypothetical protein